MSWRRTAAVLAAALVVAGACTLAGVWQWSRHEARSAQVAQVTAYDDAEPLPLSDVLAGGVDGSADRPVGGLADDDLWRPVSIVGRYVGAAVLRNRPVEGTPAVHVLGVLEVAGGPLDGALVVLDRGWLPAAEAAQAPGTNAAPGRPGPPAQVVSVVARLRAPEDPATRAAPSGQVHRIAPAQVLRAADVPGEPLALYGVVLTEDAAPPTDVRPLPRPDDDLGPHLSYAFQWWVFAAGALVGAVVLLRRDATDAAAAAAGGPARPARRPAGRPSRRRAPTAEDEEDALLDAAERRAEGAGGPGGTGSAPVSSPS